MKRIFALTLRHWADKLDPPPTHDWFAGPWTSYPITGGTGTWDPNTSHPTISINN